MNRRQPFKQHHVTRALKAAHAAGVTNPSVTFHTPDGGKIVIGGDGAKPAAVVARKPAAAAVRKPVAAVVARKPVAAVVVRRPAVTAVPPKRGR